VASYGAYQDAQPAVVVQISTAGVATITITIKGRAIGLSTHRLMSVVSLRAHHLHRAQFPAGTSCFPRRLFSRSFTPLTSLSSHRLPYDDCNSLGSALASAFIIHAANGQQADPYSPHFDDHNGTLLQRACDIWEVRQQKRSLLLRPSLRRAAK
jgi:hypothetical protein